MEESPQKELMSHHLESLNEQLDAVLSEGKVMDSYIGKVRGIENAVNEFEANPEFLDSVTRNPVVIELRDLSFPVYKSPKVRSWE